MKKSLLMAVLVLALCGATACTNMSKTQQGAASGALIGAAGGAGIAAIAHGHPGWGALAGAGAGALVGGLVGSSQEEEEYNRDYDRRPPEPRRDHRRDRGPGPDHRDYDDADYGDNRY